MTPSDLVAIDDPSRVMAPTSVILELMPPGDDKSKIITGWTDPFRPVPLVTLVRY